MLHKCLWTCRRGGRVRLMGDDMLDIFPVVLSHLTLLDREFCSVWLSYVGRAETIWQL